MADALPACQAHRALVDAAMAESPDDDVLERYATEVPACPDCQRALSVRLEVHPAVLRQGGADGRDLRGMRELWDTLREPVPASRVRWMQGAAVLAIAAGAAWALWPLMGGAPARTDLPVAPYDVVSIPILAPPIAPPEAPPVDAPEVRAPVVAAPRSAPPDPVEMDAVAMAEDWPPPPFEELRSGTAKAIGGLRSAQLVLSGAAPRRVGAAVELTVITSEATSLAVCVTGPERGVVWRGGVPAGRIDLTRAGRQQTFGFAAPGTYRFALSTADLDACSAPVHVVEVEVGS